MATSTETPTGRPARSRPGLKIAIVTGAVVVAGTLGVTTGVVLLSRSGKAPTAAGAPSSTGAPTNLSGSAVNGSGPAGAGRSGSSTGQPRRPGAAAPTGETRDPASGVVPVYVVGDTETGARLYREYRPSPGSEESPVQVALQAMAVKPADPDYRTLWSGVRVQDLRRSGGEASISLLGRPQVARTGDAALAVQQLVYTVTAADPTITQVVLSGQALPAGVAGGPYARAPQADVLAPVWLLSPMNGATVSRRLTLTGSASVFEATVAIEARQGTRVGARASATATTGAPNRGTWTAKLTLAPGKYKLVAFEASMKDGSARYADSKQVTVR